MSVPKQYIESENLKMKLVRETEKMIYRNTFDLPESFI